MAEDTTEFTFSWMDDEELPVMKVMQFKGEEALGEAYSFDIDLFAKKEDGVKPSKLIGKAACLTLDVFDQKRSFHGMVEACRINKELDEGLHYSLRLSPRITRLQGLTNNAVYIDQDLPKTLEELLEAAGLGDDDYKTDHLKDYRKWSFRCQYGETHFNFLQRIIEREGVYYYFEQQEGSEKIIFCDALSQHPEDDDPLSLNYDPNLGGTYNTEDPEKASLIVSKWFSHGQRLPKKIILKDYNSETPSANIQAEEEVDPQGFGEVYRYADNLVDTDEATQLAERAAERLLMKKDFYTAQTQNPSIQPGQIFTLTGHFLDNDDYYPYQIEHQGFSTDYYADELEEGLAAYTNTLTCVASGIQFRPEPKTEKPRFYGVLHGIIDGDEDDEASAYLDDEGRYKVHLPFDRVHQANSRLASCWIHRIQPTAGTGGDMHFPLLGGTEVAVSFIGGDPDRPVIAGALPNSAYPEAVKADNKTQSILKSSKDNQILMDDQDDYIHLSLSSPIATSQLHLGSFDAENQGSLLTTEGVVRTLGSGGEISTLATESYLADKNLALLLEQDAGDLIDQELFAFPKFKLDAYGNLDGELSSQDELTGNYLVRRTAGNLYEWRDGPSYLFWNLNSPEYEFGNREINRYAEHPSEELTEWTLPDCSGATWEPATNFVEKVWGDHFFYHKGNTYQWREKNHGLYIMGRCYTEFHPGAVDAELNPSNSKDDAPDGDDWLIHKIMGSAYRYVDQNDREIVMGRSEKIFYGYHTETFEDKVKREYKDELTETYNGRNIINNASVSVTNNHTNDEINIGASKEIDISASTSLKLGASLEFEMATGLKVSVGALNTEIKTGMSFELDLAGKMELNNKGKIKLCGKDAKTTLSNISTAAKNVKTAAKETYMKAAMSGMLGKRAETVALFSVLPGIEIHG